MESLLKTLEETTSSLDKQSHAAITREIEKLESAAYRIRIQAVKIKSTGLEGREFTV